MKTRLEGAPFKVVVGGGPPQDLRPRPSPQAARPSVAGRPPSVRLYTEVPPRPSRTPTVLQETACAPISAIASRPRKTEVAETSPPNVATPAVRPCDTIL